MKLEECELVKIEGGALKTATYGILLALGGLAALIAGIIDGYMNPIRCRI